ncbi:uncharacterized protein [Cherax quadricarinatus]|uniref:uncharacterized protein n=1 Tax=Cherax quadricarinatus TaxID=27406 RepID=UPI00387EA9BA
MKGPNDAVFVMEDLYMSNMVARKTYIYDRNSQRVNAVAFITAAMSQALHFTRSSPLSADIQCHEAYQVIDVLQISVSEDTS